MNKHSIMAILTKACNWNCEYCSDRNTTEKIDEAFILKEIESIFKNHKHHLTQLNLSGGEPGILSEHFWKHIILLIKQYDMKEYINIYSNGLIFRHRIIEELLENIHSLKWHIVPDLKSNITLPEFDIFNFSNIEEILIYDDSKYFELMKFLQKQHKKIHNLSIVFNSDINKTQDTKSILTLLDKFNSKYNKNAILKYDADVQKPSQKNILECMKRFKTIRINFKEKTISPCCKIVKSNIVFNEFNLNQMMTNQICVYDQRCLSCNVLLK